MARQIIDSNSISAAGSAYSAPFRMFKGLKTTIFLKVELDGAASGTNTLLVEFESTPEPHRGDSATYFVESDRSVFPKIVFTETEVQDSSKQTEMIHVEGDYDQGRIKFTYAGTGSNTFKYSLWVTP